MVVAARVIRPFISLKHVAHHQVISRSWRAYSNAAATPYYSALSSEQKNQIDTFLDTLLDWNTRMNLTAITDRDEAYLRHVEDSLALLPAIDACVAAQGSDDIKLIDVGSGAGLPGIILATARPEWSVTLLDSLKKRCTFNEAAIEASELKNVSVVWSRAEEAGQNGELREQHDIVVARAVAELRILAELCLPLVKVGGYWVAAKGANPQEEVEAAARAIKELGGELERVEEVDSEAPDGRRCVVIVKKKHFTKTKYPRKPGTPKKQPL